MTTLVTGGTGFVGQRLVKAMPDCVITSRNGDLAKKRFGDSISQAITWNPASSTLDLDPEQNFSAVVNLMGEPIAEGRWTKKKKERLRTSRVDGTNKLVDAILKQDVLPEVFVSGSAVGFYGSKGNEIVTETSSKGSGYLSELCEDWENASGRLVEAGVRVVLVRIGIVLGREGGALGKLIPLFKTRLGGRLGNGNHWVPWIHIEDLVSLLVWAIKNKEIEGIVNATAPNPVTNKVLTKELAKALEVPAFLPVPKFAVRLALGEFSNSLFRSQRVMPKVAIENGFRFTYPQIDDAFKEVISNG